MTEYGRDRERRRRTRALLGAGHLVALTVSLGLATGWVPVAATLSGLLVLMVAVFSVIRAPGRRARRTGEVGELFGRLSLVEGELRWEPRKADRGVVPLWGPGAPGCLMLTSPGRTAVDIWIRHPADLRRELAGRR